MAPWIPVEWFGQYHDLAVRILTALAAVLLVYAAGRLVAVPPLVRFVRVRNPDNPTLPTAFGQYARAAVAFVAVAVGLSVGGFNGLLGGSALILAATTVAVGVAGQEVIGNLVSGVFLVLDPDFNVGDYVEWGNHAGTVEEVDIRVTRVRTAAGESLTVPNTELAATTLRRPFAGERYRITQTLGVPYGSDVERASELLQEAAAADDRVLEEPAPTVDGSGFGSASHDLSVRFWVDPNEASPADVRTAFQRRVDERFEEAGLTINPASQHRLSGHVAVEGAAEHDSLEA
jgi:small-conductance mechanosensitive channel